MFNSTDSYRIGGQAEWDWGSAENRSNRYYTRLFAKFIWPILICSLLPLLVLSWVISSHYMEFARQRVLTNFKQQVNNHRKTIQLFLMSRKSTLKSLARTHDRAYFSQQDNLQKTFGILNSEYDDSFTDLGLIDSRGNHLAYVGPYDLIEKNYMQAHWFKEVMRKGVYISDIFMGFRKSPHFVIAVTRHESGEKWILRATIDSNSFQKLVQSIQIAGIGQVYLVNENGLLQTCPEGSGQIMQPDPFGVPVHKHQGIEVRTLKSEANTDGQKGFDKYLVASAWLDNPNWMLIVRQNYLTAFSEVNQTIRTTLTFLLLTSFIIIFVALLSTVYILRVIKRRDQEMDQMNNQLMQAGKLASVGELSAGVAHEINNPLGIILTEKQLIQDLLGQNPSMEELKNQLEDSLQQIGSQIGRCKQLTQNLLRFARRTQSSMEQVDINRFLQEVIDLMEREARSGGIKIFTDFDQQVENLYSDPSQLQQVFLNLMNNAIDAQSNMPYGNITFRTKSDQKRKGVHIEVSDSGMGIARENLDKIFDPFFTTKPVGKGTGLGLSICFGIIKRLGGEIGVESEPGQGTTFKVFLPYQPPDQVA